MLSAPFNFDVEKKDDVKTELTEIQHCSVVKEMCSDGMPSAHNYLLAELFSNLLSWLTKSVGL